MATHQIKIVTDGAIEPATLGGVSADDQVTITNESGTGATINYQAGTNPFSDTKNGTTEALSNGSSTTHTITASFDPNTTYELLVDMAASEFLSSPKIRITGSRDS